MLVLRKFTDNLVNSTDTHLTIPYCMFQAGACWGYYQFFRIDLLEKEGYLLPDEDTISLRFFVRPLTYAATPLSHRSFCPFYYLYDPFLVHFEMRLKLQESN